MTSSKDQTSTGISCGWKWLFCRRDSAESKRDFAAMNSESKRLTSLTNSELSLGLVWILPHGLCQHNGGLTNWSRCWVWLLFHTWSGTTGRMSMYLSDVIYYQFETWLFVKYFKCCGSYCFSMWSTRILAFVASWWTDTSVLQQQGLDPAPRQIHAIPCTMATVYLDRNELTYYWAPHV